MEVTKLTVKFTLTTDCGAQCATCPSWKRPVLHGNTTDLKTLWGRMIASRVVEKIIVNNTGDIYSHPDHIELLKFMERHKGGKFVSMTTNAVRMDYVPNFDQLIVSFNGATKEAYEKSTGMSWHEVRDNLKLHLPEIRTLYPDGRLEMHCLVWDETSGNEGEILRAWGDWPGRIRLSYKYDNQCEEDHTVEGFKATERIPCDYLGMLCVQPDGGVVMCAHDWTETEKWGNLLENSPEALMSHPRRLKKAEEHRAGLYSGVCGKCNYNVSAAGKIVYVK